VCCTPDFVDLTLLVLQALMHAVPAHARLDDVRRSNQRRIGQEAPLGLARPTAHNADERLGHTHARTRTPRAHTTEMTNLDFDANDGRAGVGVVVASAGVREEREIGHEEGELAVGVNLGVLSPQLRPALLDAGAHCLEERRHHHYRHLGLHMTWHMTSSAWRTLAQHARVVVM
jgi:hypothetical protein